MQRLLRLARLSALLCLAWVLLAPAGWT